MRRSALVHDDLVCGGTERIAPVRRRDRDGYVSQDVGEPRSPQSPAVEARDQRRQSRRPDSMSATCRRRGPTAVARRWAPRNRHINPRKAWARHHNSRSVRTGLVRISGHSHAVCGPHAEQPRTVLLDIPRSWLLPPDSTWGRFPWSHGFLCGAHGSGPPLPAEAATLTELFRAWRPSSREAIPSNASTVCLLDRAEIRRPVVSAPTASLSSRHRIADADRGLSRPFSDARSPQSSAPWAAAPASQAPLVSRETSLTPFPRARGAVGRRRDSSRCLQQEALRSTEGAPGASASHPPTALAHDGEAHRHPPHFCGGLRVRPRRACRTTFSR